MTTPTPTEIRDAYLDNADYEADGSLAKANLFVAACLRLLAQPSSVSVDGQAVAFDLASVRESLTHARRWIAANTAGGKAKYLDFSGLRS